MNSQLRLQVFLPSFLLLLAAVILSIANPTIFLESATAVNKWILNQFGWLFSIVALLMVLICVAIWFSPMGRIRIGGEDAEPLLDRWRWFAITLCTTIATGILFWGTAEPVYHLQAQSVGNTATDEVFAMSTMYLHWTLTPYAIYAIPTIMFAIAFYNKGLPFSLASMFFPFFKERPPRWFSNVVDSICLFSLVAGMSASLGSGLLSLVGGLQKLVAIEKTPLVLALICLAIVISFIISAATGLQKGIRTLSNINTIGFFVIATIVFAFGSIVETIKLAVSGFGEYLWHFPQKSMYAILHPTDSWSFSWTVFYWAVWMAWAPISALFLGRISKGYTVREMLLFNWLIPAAFGGTWMAIFSGNTIVLQQSGKVNLVDVLTHNGPESVLYVLLEQYPFAMLLTLFFVVLIFLSFVTAADSNTSAMAGISSKGISGENAAPPIYVKVIWGIIIGATAFVMINSAGIEGIKMISNIGGFPAMFLILGVTIGILMIIMKGDKDFQLPETPEERE